MWKEFFETLQRLRERGAPYVVATVVKVSGSTYRRPGARVLITKDGTQTGLISGGCFESELMDRARSVIGSGKPALVTFDTTSPDDILFGLGLGCTGVAHILLEPYRDSQPNYLDLIAECVKERLQGFLATVYQPASAHLMISNNQTRAENAMDPQVTSALIAESRKLTDKTWTHFKGEVEALIERIILPLPLYIFGAGPDAAPLVRFAKQLGWHITVIDKRPAFARADRFPDADSVLLADPDNFQIEVEPDAAAVVMTHHFETDAAFLKRLLDSNIRYIGLLGPKAKSELLMQKLRQEGIEPSPQQQTKIFAPVGLDIGAETPEEIALSIVSEIQAVCGGYSGGSLKSRTGPIHSR